MGEKEGRRSEAEGSEKEGKMNKTVGARNEKEWETQGPRMGAGGGGEGMRKL